MARDRGGPDLALQLLEVPVTDISTGAATTTRPVALFGEGYGLDEAEMEFYAEQYLGDLDDGRPPYASPLLAGDVSGVAPAHVITAEYDMLRDSGEAYAGRLEGAGVETTLHRRLGHNHGSSVLWQDLASGARVDGRGRRRAAPSLRRRGRLPVDRGGRRSADRCASRGRSHSPVPGRRPLQHRDRAARPPRRPDLLRPGSVSATGSAGCSSRRCMLPASRPGASSASMLPLRSRSSMQPPASRPIPSTSQARPTASSALSSPSSRLEVTTLHVGTLALATDPPRAAIAELAEREARTRALVVDPNVRPAVIEDRDAYLSRFERLVSVADLV